MGPTPASLLHGGEHLSDEQLLPLDLLEQMRSDRTRKSSSKLRISLRDVQFSLRTRGNVKMFIVHEPGEIQKTDKTNENIETV